jgi:cytochrome c5
MMRWLTVVAMVWVLAGCGESGTQTAGGEAAAHPGEQTYTRFCFSCHAAGIAGAPKVGNAEQWAPRIAKGSEALLASTIAGIPPGMPARGLCNQCSDEELAIVIDYMISKSQ